MITKTIHCFYLQERNDEESSRPSLGAENACDFEVS